MSATAATAVFLTTAPAALADSTGSSNWAGYAVHRSGVSFAKVSASWRQPSVSCNAGAKTYSAYWVGIGGFTPGAPALEQIGTEANCSTGGHPVLAAWYEIVPAPSTPIAFTLNPGDRIDATVTVKGHQVTMSLYDATRHRGYTRTLTARTVDTSSAEWIVEAPSSCTSAHSCQTLPLANFGTATFESAQAQSAAGRLGSISSPGWGWTKINLVPNGGQFVAYPGRASGAATASGLRAGGSSFNVSYSVGSALNRLLAVRSAPAPAPAPAPGQLVHPAR